MYVYVSQLCPQQMETFAETFFPLVMLDKENRGQVSFFYTRHGFFSKFDHLLTPELI